MSGAGSSRHPSRDLGQNFLIHSRSIERIHRALALDDDEGVLEIGPGRGALTRGLLRVERRVVAVELDARLVELLRRRFDGARLDVLHGDILETRLDEIARRLDVQRVAVVGNLPYWISKPVAVKLVAERRAVKRAVLMFQREVARRLTAAPGGREYGPLTVLCGRVFRIESLFDLAPSRFRPAPKVFSAVTRWTPRDDAPLDDAGLARLRACLGAAFSSRRKTLRNNLRGALGSESAALELLERAEIDGGLRAEAVPPEAFVRLAAIWRGGAS
jgi:16S rRNA (adenine1518-N6/adenine1519-N6)-dimethyltransferase